MKKHLKILSFLLCLIMTFSIFAACAPSNEANTDKNTEAKETVADNKDETEKPSNTSTEATETDTPTDDDTNDTESSATSAATDEAEDETDPEGQLTIYKNKAYEAKFIRSDIATQLEKDQYNALREIFKGKTQKAVPFSSDFTAANAEKYDGPAVLFGETNYEESANLYATLKEHQAAARIVGNKYVIAFTSSEALEELLAKIQDRINKAPANTLILNSTWEFDVTVSGVVYISEIPLYNGAAFDENVDAGQGSRVLVKNSTSETEFNQYLSSLPSAGYTLYTTNTLDSNLFATYTNDKYILHAMYFPALQRATVAMDHRDRFGLAGLESENVYDESDKPTEFTQLGLAAIPGATANGMGYMVKLTDGRFVLVDGGYTYSAGGGANSADFLLKTMKQVADDPDNIVIAAWIVTHIHTDHAGGFVGMGNAHPKDVTVQNLIYNQPNDIQMDSAGLSERTKWISTAIENFEKAGNPIKNVIKAHPGQQFFFCDLTITMIGTMDLLEPYNLYSGNNSSLVMTFEMNGGKVLLTGDCEPDEGKAIRDIYGGIDNMNSCLKSDFVQLSHHGYGNTKTESNPDRSALNVMAAAGREIYALIPVAYTKLEGDPGGYEDAVKNAIQNNMFAEDKRIIAHDINVTITFNKDGTHVIGDGSYTKGEGWKTGEATQTT